MLGKELTDVWDEAASHVLMFDMIMLLQTFITATLIQRLGPADSLLIKLAAP